MTSQNGKSKSNSKSNSNSNSKSNDKYGGPSAARFALRSG